MTDSEIVKALECCSRGFSCKLCPYYEPCNSVLCRDALDLINRQQAEIEALKCKSPDYKYLCRVRVKNGLIYTKTLDDYDWLIGDISTEAVKEFADLLVSKAKSAKERFLLESLVDSVKREVGCNDESET